MRKSLRIALAILFSMILFLIITGITVVFLINPNDFKPQIIQKVKDYSGRTLKLNGDLNWSFFPWIGIKVNDAELSNSPGFGNQPFASVAHADMQLKLIPLLSGKIELGKLTLDKFKLNLITDKAGNTNWQDAAKTKRPETESNSTEGKESSNKFLLMGIAGVNVTDGHIRWIDQAKNQTYDINHLQINTNNIKFNEPFSTDIQLNLASNNPKLNTTIKLTSDITLLTDEKRYLLKNINFNSQLNDNKYPQGKLNLNAQIKSIEIDLDKQTLIVNQLKTAIANLTISGDLLGKNITDNLSLFGQLKIAEFNLGELLATLDKQSKANNKLNNVAATFQLQATNNSIKLDNIKGHLNDSNINGSFAINDFTKKMILFNIAMDKLNLDNFSANKKPLETAATEFFVDNAVAANDESILPTDTLRTLNAQGELKIGSLQSNKLHLTNLALQLNATNGLVNINNITASLFQGIYQGNISIDTRTANPRINNNSSFKQIQIESLFNSLIEENNKIKLAGTGNVNANINMIGNTKSAWMKTLTGKGNLQVSQGIIKGIDIPYWVAAGKALVHKQQTDQANTKQTHFDTLTATFIANNGIINNNDLLLHARGMRISGTGNLNLNNEQINYLITGQPLNPGTDKPQGFAVPLKITGSFNNISVFPAIDQLAREIAKQQASEKLNEIIDKKLGKGAGAELQKRFHLDALFK